MAEVPDELAETQRGWVPPRAPAPQRHWNSPPETRHSQTPRRFPLEQEVVEEGQNEAEAVQIPF